jgi:pilus assembly protein CpaE
MAEKILIIDDDMDTLRLVGLMLQRQGYEIVAANNGKQGIEKAAEESPDLILLDVMMPDMDGYEVTRQLRAMPETASTPILMFTAKSQLDDKVTGFEAGVDDYLTKPTHPSELQAHIKALLARAQKNVPVQPTAPLRKYAYSIAVIAARGGLGVSTIALNLASTLREKTGEEVILMETHPGRGTIGRDLGITDLDGLVSLLSLSPIELTAKKTQDALVEDPSGLKCLFASDRPVDGKLITETARYETLFTRLRPLSRYLVLDMGAGILPYTWSLLGKSDLILVVVEPVVNSLVHARALLNDMLDNGIEKENIIVALNNRIRSELLIQRKQAQDTIGRNIDISIIPAPEVFIQAIRVQKPAVLHQPEGLTAKQFGQLADLVIERSEQEK